MKKYRPSNGSEGMWFTERFCERCAHDQDTGKECPILMRTMLHEVDEPEYPSEWTYDQDGKPTCTAFTEPPTQEEPNV